MQETERILRANDYLYDAVIVPVAYDGERVDLEVRTRDVWTLNPGISFSRKGGENTLGAQLQEDNLLGTGRSLDFEWDEQRRPHVARGELLRSALPAQLHPLRRWATWTPTTADTKLLQLDRPFYALDVRRAGGVYLLDSERNDPRYVLGKNVGEFGHREEFYEAYGGRSRGLRRAAGRGAGRPGSPTSATASRSSPVEPLGRPAAGGPHARLSVDRLRPRRGRLPGAHQPGPDPAAPRTCWWAARRRASSVTRPRRSAPIAMRSC